MNCYNRKRINSNDNSLFNSKIRKSESTSKFDSGSRSSEKEPLRYYETKKLLDKMLENDFAENIILLLLDPSVRFKNFLNNADYLNPVNDMVILQILVKVSENETMTQNFRSLLTMVLGTTFASKHLNELILVYLKETFDVSMLQLLIKFFKICFINYPEMSFKVFNTNIMVMDIIFDFQRIKCGDSSSSILNEFKELKTLSEVGKIPISKKGCFKRINDCNNSRPPDDYRGISIFPTGKDLLTTKTNEIFLRDNKVEGAYNSVNHYLDVQFRLMREDFLRPLRDGLQCYRDSKQTFPDIRVYEKVTVLNSLPALKFGIIFNLKFNKLHEQNINWKRSKTFLHGSLLCLSNDDFKTLLFATTVDSDLANLKQGVLSVKFHDCIPSKREEYILIETTNLFESYRHVLLKLQNTNEINLCMAKYLVYSERKVDNPQYLTRDMVYEFKDVKISPVNITYGWPSAKSLEMDESQFKAFKSALTKEIVLIQGPPGTGKTYLGLNICKCLIENAQKYLLSFEPILVVCYTNHALDTFLEGISNFTDNIVRIGSRCNSEEIQRFSIINWKNKNPSSEYTTQKNYLYNQLRKLSKKINEREAFVQYSNERCLNLEMLGNVISKHHKRYLDKIGLENWLSGKSLKETFCPIYIDVIQSLINDEINANKRKIVTEARKEYSENKDPYIDKRDNARYYLNSQQKLDIDEEDIDDSHSHFQKTLKKYYNQNEQFKEWSNPTTERLFEHRLRNEEEISSSEEESILENMDFYSLDERWMIYRFWRTKYIETMYSYSEELHNEYDNFSKQLNEILFLEDKEIMEKRSVIGMTTTGAARYSNILSSIGCKIIIVEEAAQVLESHIIGSLNPRCEHLILIGDHKQLKPSPAVYDLAKRYKLDTSMFERLIMNKLEYTTLLLQHRMRPEIADIMGFIYKDLQNHESVLKYPNVPSLEKNVYFIQHEEFEENMTNTFSYANKFEANFIVLFCRHLLKNGVQSTQITILTLYAGQMFELQGLMKENIYDGVRVCVVDNFQGEENDIILLSLVRSNEFEKIGFLSVENRICVSLSRAKHGLYVIRNFKVLGKQNAKWNEICTFLEKKKMIGKTITFFCQNHPERKTLISKPDDFLKIPEGGCNQICKGRLNCGHACKKLCHFLDKKHEHVICMEQCLKVCEFSHKCHLKCSEECTECIHPVLKRIPGCRHLKLIPCGKEPLPEDCLKKCDKELNCGHQCLKLCNRKCEPCLTEVRKMLPECGHVGLYHCSDTKTDCIAPCDSLLGCGHICVGTCGSCYRGRLHKHCKCICRNQLICGHVCMAFCSFQCPPCPRRCEEGCSHNSCPNTCGEECVQCTEQCQWQCIHKKCKKLCWEFCDRDVCNEREHFDRVTCQKCRRLFSYYGVCGEICRKTCFKCDNKTMFDFFGTEDEKNAIFITLWTCGHSFEVNAMDKYMASISQDGEIVAKRCPSCLTIINKRSCFRYLNNTKNISFEIKEIQKKITKNVADFSKYKIKLDTYFEVISEMFQVHGLQCYFDIKEELRVNDVFLFQTSLTLMYDVLKPTFFDGKHIHSDYVMKGVHDIIVWLNPRKRIFNDFEVDQFNNEFKRLEFLMKVDDVRHKVDKQYKEFEFFDKELKIVNFSKDIYTNLKERWNSFMKEKLYLPNTEIMEYEMKEIVNAVGFGKGRWFKCPKGHFYVIGECGGAVSISKCPECNSYIGGQHHSLLHDNSSAMEMDLLRF